jgi:PAS domain-containing protein
MAGPGDRGVAGLLSALAEAPDFNAAASFFLTQLGEIAGTPRACLLQLDGSRENLELVASTGFDAPLPSIAISAGDLSNPLLISALTIRALRGTSPLPHRALAALVPWIALPLSQPRQRGTPGFMPHARAVELLGSSPVTFLEMDEPPVGAAPAGVVVIQGDGGISAEQIAAALDVVTLASPVLARLVALEDARKTAERLTQQCDRLTLMVDSLPDPVVIMNAANDIIAQNSRAGRLLHARDDDSPGRRRALELNNLLFTSFLSKAAMTGGQQSGPRELNLVDPDEGNDLLFEVLAHPLGERVGPENSVLSVLRDVTDLRRAANELERQVQRVRHAEVTVRGERDRLNLILENVADPILVTDERSNIILMNDQAEQLFQISDPQSRNRKELASVRGNDTKFTSFISEFAINDDDSRRERMSLVIPRTGV